MSTNLKYSVLMSLYYKEKPEYLEKSIDSMINQTVKPDEIVIVKDGPLTDELEKVLNEYQQRYPKVFNIVISEENIGLGRALNLGLKHCKNELVARMDTDDISMLDRCEKQLHCFKKDIDLSIVGSNISEFIETEGNIVSRRNVPSKDQQIKEYIGKRCPFNHVSVMFKKSKVMSVGSYKEWFWNEDYYLWIRMFEVDYKFENLNEELVKVRVGTDMYKRRGGIKYFKSELGLQNYMLRKKIIGIEQYLYNSIIRFIIQVIMPNNIRGYIFKRFARN